MTQVELAVFVRVVPTTLRICQKREILLQSLWGVGPTSGLDYLLVLSVAPTSNDLTSGILSPFQAAVQQSSSALVAVQAHP
jgi:hypothetical protein